MALTAAACGDNLDRSGLDALLPEVPPPTGASQNVFAGQVDDDNAAEELLPGSAASGMAGDFYIRNGRARFIIQAADRVIGAVPQGGNLIDAQLVDENGPTGEDHFGELSTVYLLGRTCEHQSVEVVQDGSGGGAAAIIARGKSGVNDFINFAGIGLFPIAANLDPDIPDGIECATTYILEPDSPNLEVYWSFYNAGESRVRGPLGALSDTGGEIEVWASELGFKRLGIDSLAGGDVPPAPTTYAVFQGPNVAYGLFPYHQDLATRNASLLIAGVSALIFNADELFDILTQDGVFLALEPGEGLTQQLRFSVGHDAADIEEQVRDLRGEPVQSFSGTAMWASGAPAVGARVGVFRDDDSDGEIGPDDTVVSYADAGTDGSFGGTIAAGSYLLRADVFGTGRSAVVPLDLSADVSGVAIEIPDPVYFDYTVLDDENDEVIPARIVIVGDNPVATDDRLFSVYDSFAGVTDTIIAPHGTSTDLGDGADRRIALAPGGTYRVLAMRGTEWSVASEPLAPMAGDPDGTLELRLRRVVDTTGYVASEYHVHSIGSPDAPVDYDTRVETAIADGVELFASTEHDYIADLQSVAEALGFERLVRVIPGLETTPFAFGHFNAWPIEADPSDPSRGAIDWARGLDGYALVPGQIFEQMRQRGAELVQVNHPRSAPGAVGDFMQFFDRAALTFDYESRSIGGDALAQPVANQTLRLPPDQSLWDMTFNALEVWNGFAMSDTNEDGRREIVSLDLVMRDWFNFLSFGFEVAPLGNSDTHSVTRDPVGMPRSMVRVADDSADAVESGQIATDAIETLAGRGPTPRDIVVTNGPHLRVMVQGETESAIGQTIDASGSGEVTFSIEVDAATWASFDTIEVFANQIPDTTSRVTALQPLQCFSELELAELDPADPCALAPLGVGVLAPVEAAVAPGFNHITATVNVTIAADDLPVLEGGTGEDAWVVIRVRGNRAIYPLLLSEVITPDNLGTLVSGTDQAIADALIGTGVYASAFTAPIYLDFDGGGYRAPFAPE